MGQETLQNREKSVGYWFGAVFVALGLMPMVLILIKPEALNVPLWVAEIGASAFIFAGLSFIAQSKGRSAIARILSICVMLVLIVVGLYFLLD